MLYELINPSDPYIFEADSFGVAVITGMLLGMAYGVEPQSGEDYFPIPLFNPHAEQDFEQRFGASPKDYLSAHRPEVIKALKSLMLGHFEDYKRYKAACEAIDDPDKLKVFREKWFDSISSINNIHMKAEQLIDLLHQKEES